MYFIFSILVVHLANYCYLHTSFYFGLIHVIMLLNAEVSFLFQMQNLGIQPSSRTWDGFVRAVVSERGFSIGMEVVMLLLFTL